jgi:hypothetical protein
MSLVTELTDAEVQAVIVAMPRRKFQQRRYLDCSRDVPGFSSSRPLEEGTDDPGIICSMGISGHQPGA